MQSPVTVQAALARATQALARAGSASCALDAALLMAHALRVPRASLLFQGERTLEANEIEAFNACIARRKQREPVAYIIGEKEFWSLDFYVTRDTLIPRPDSETLIEAALKRVQNRKHEMREEAPGQAKPIEVLDIGTGTGCLLVALLHELPESRGVGVDNSERALQVAGKNARRHGVETRATFIRSHWCDAIDGTFDLIVSNPPYIAADAMHMLMPDVLHFEPHAALAAGPEGLEAYRALAKQTADRLNPGGYALFEVGQGQADAVSALLSGHGLRVEEREKDLAGIERCVVGRKADHHRLKS